MTVYPGHIDMPDLGQDATPANERNYSNEQLVSVFDKLEAIAKQMDRFGWDTLWLAEHHFQREGYEVLPNLLILAVHLAHVTKRLKVGCGFNITPMWHPLRLAEDYAVADILTRGRTVFGVGRAIHRAPTLEVLRPRAGLRRRTACNNGWLAPRPISCEAKKLKDRVAVSAASSARAPLGLPNFTPRATAAFVRSIRPASNGSHLHEPEAPHGGHGPRAGAPNFPENFFHKAVNMGQRVSP